MSSKGEKLVLLYSVEIALLLKATKMIIFNTGNVPKLLLGLICLVSAFLVVIYIIKASME